MNTRARPGGQASRNDARRARTRSLNRIESTPAGDIDTELTRGRTSAEDEAVTSLVSHDVPPDADTAVARPSGAASSTATTLHQRPCTGDPPP